MKLLKILLYMALFILLFPLLVIVELTKKY